MSTVASAAVAARTDTHAPDRRRGTSGLPTATALVIGSVVGTGLFALPSALAPSGPISPVAFVLVTSGAAAAPGA